MLETASILSAFLCFALLHGADPKRLPERLAKSVSAFDAWRLGARLASLLFFAFAVWLWSRAGDGAAVWAGPFAAWMMSGVIIVLVRPVWGRLVWGIAAACPPVIIVMSVLGGIHGG